MGKPVKEETCEIQKILSPWHHMISLKFPVCITISHLLIALHYDPSINRCHLTKLYEITLFYGAVQSKVILRPEIVLKFMSPLRPAFILFAVCRKILPFRKIMKTP